MVSWIVIAFILDLIIGDPYTWPHPVKFIGNFISFFQKQFITENISETKKRQLGIILWLITVLGTGLITFGILTIAFKLNWLVGATFYIYLSYTTLATKSLADEGKKVFQTLQYGTIAEARYQVSMIVGRDTNQLTEEEIAKATIETVAENASDGVIAPLLCLFIGGPTLAMMYKAVNTLDSMVGYVTPKYKAIGWFSAKMDDIFNFIPARITWLLLIIASFIQQMHPLNAIKIGLRDCRKHKSPNSGFPEAVAAGALGIQLGGTHSYHGVEIFKPTIGVALNPVKAKDISKMNRLLYTAAIIGLAIFSLCAIGLQKIF